jgi:hypothetical protein
MDTLSAKLKNAKPHAVVGLAASETIKMCAAIRFRPAIAYRPYRRRLPNNKGRIGP